MCLLNEYERKELKQSSYLKKWEMEHQFDVVTYFYPDQQLTLALTDHDVVNITGCDYWEADDLRTKVCRKLRVNSWDNLTVSDLCYYLKIDEMLIQVFLASLRESGPLPPAEDRKPAPNTPEEAVDGPPRKLVEIKADLQKGVMESFETILIRRRLWEIANPRGEPMFSVANPFFRVIIRPFEVAQILGIHIDTAREMFRQTREEKNLPKQRYMSITMFCTSHYLDEEDIRKALAEMYNDKAYGAK